MTPPSDDSRLYVDVLRQLREQWVREGVALSAVATVAEIQDFERLHGVQFPEDLKRFFLEIGGMKNPDSQHLRVWPISEMALVSPHECETSALPVPSLLIADYLLMSHVFAVHLGASSPVFITGGATARIAGSFEAFLRAYLADPDSMLAGFDV